MYSYIYSGFISNFTPCICTVEADVRNGLPNFQLLSNVSQEIRDSKERIRVAIENSDFLIPPKRITVNILPANVKKTGSGFDLGIALSILQALEYIPLNYTDYFAIGGLTLDGHITGVTGIIALLNEARSKGVNKAIIPIENMNDAVCSLGIEIFPVKTLSEAVDVINGKAEPFPMLEPLGKQLFYCMRIPEFELLGLKIAGELDESILFSGYEQHEVARFSEGLLHFIKPLDIEIRRKISGIYEIVNDMNRSNLLEYPCLTYFDGMMDTFLAEEGVLYIENAFELKEKEKKLVEQMKDKTHMVSSIKICSCNKAIGQDCNCTVKAKERARAKLDLRFYKDFGLLVRKPRDNQHLLDGLSSEAPLTEKQKEVHKRILSAIYVIKKENTIKFLDEMSEEEISLLARLYMCIDENEIKKQ